MPSLTDYINNPSTENSFWTADVKPRFELQKDDFTLENLARLEHLLQNFSEVINYDQKRVIIDAHIAHLKAYFLSLSVYQAYICKTLEADYGVANQLVKTAQLNPYAPRLIRTLEDAQSPAVTLVSLNCIAYSHNYAPLSDATPTQKILRTIHLLENLARIINSEDVNVIHLQQLSHLYLEPLLRPMLGSRWALVTNAKGLISLYDKSVFTCQTENIAMQVIDIGPTLSLKLKSVANKHLKMYVINHRCKDNLLPEIVELAYRNLLTMNQQHNSKGTNKRAAILVHSSNNFLDEVYVSNGKERRSLFPASYFYLDPRTDFAVDDRKIPAKAQRSVDYQRRLRLTAMPDSQIVIAGKSVIGFEKYLRDVFPLEAATITVRMAVNQELTPAIAIEFPTDFSVTLEDLQAQLNLEDEPTSLLIIAINDTAALLSAIDSLLIRNHVMALLEQQYQVLTTPSVLKTMDPDKNAAVAELIETLKAAPPGSSVAHFSLLIRAWEVENKELIDRSRNMVSSATVSGLNSTQRTIKDIYQQVNPVNNTRNRILSALVKEKERLTHIAAWQFRPGETYSQIVFVDKMIALLQEFSGAVTYQQLHESIDAEIADGDFYLNGAEYGNTSSPLRTFMEEQRSIVVQCMNHASIGVSTRVIGDTDVVVRESSVNVDSSCVTPTSTLTVGAASFSAAIYESERHSSTSVNSSIRGLVEASKIEL